MKKTLFTILVIVFSYHLQAQLSLWIDNKYGFKMPGSYDQFGGYGNSTSSTSASTYTMKKYCFGNGYQGSIGFRYGFKNNFGVDIGYAFLLGQKSKTNYKGNYDTGENIIKARFSRYMVGLSYLNNAKLSPIVKIGAFISHGKVISNNKSTQTNTTYSYNPNPPYNSYTITTTDVEEDEYQLRKGVSIGFYSSLGVSYPVTENLVLALSADVVFQNYCPKKGTRTKFTENGVDKLGTLTTYQKETEYKAEYTNIYTSTPNQNVPDVAPKFSVPLNSIGPSFTIYYTFGKKKSPENKSENAN